MKTEIIIPEFKKKELTAEYMTDSFYDERTSQIYILWEILGDWNYNLSFSEVFKLKEYKNKAEKYAETLIALLTDKPYRPLCLSQMQRFDEVYNPKSNADKLIYKIFKNVLDEIIWIDEILTDEMQHHGICKL